MPKISILYYFTDTRTRYIYYLLRNLLILDVPEAVNNQREEVRAGGPRRANVGRANVRNRFRGLSSSYCCYIVITFKSIILDLNRRRSAARGFGRGQSS